MGLLRTIVRAPILAVILVGALLSASIGGTFARLSGGERALGSWRTRVFRRAARMVAGTLGMRVKVSGSPPEPPFILVSNHLSYVDVILIGSQTRCVFVSKAEVEDWPLVGAVVRSVGTLFLDRKAKRELPSMVRRIEEVLESGRGIVFFPEGTTGRGDCVAPFRPSLLALAAKSGRPVHYASISYRTARPGPPAEQAVCWWGDMKFTPHILQIMAMPGFQATVRFGTEPIHETDRKVLASRLQLAVLEQFEAVV